MVKPMRDLLLSAFVIIAIVGCSNSSDICIKQAEMCEALEKTESIELIVTFQSNTLKSEVENEFQAADIKVLNVYKYTPQMLIKINKQQLEYVAAHKAVKILALNSANQPEVLE